MPSPHPFVCYFGRILTGGAAPLAVVLSFAMVAIPVHADAGEAAMQSDPRALRVAAVAYRLALANATLCEAMMVTPSSFGLPGKDIERTQAILDGKQHERAVTSGNREHDGEQEPESAASEGCPTKVTLIQDDVINAWADGTGIRLTTGLLARCRSDDDLALVLGHEMAHNLLRQRQRLEDNGGGASGLLPANEKGVKKFHEIEEEADRFGVNLVMTSGYDLAGAAAFMDGLLDRSIGDSETHPAPERRLALLRLAIAQAQRDRVGALPSP